MKGSDVLSYVGIFIEGFLTVRTSVDPIFFVNIHMIFQAGHLLKLYATDGAVILGVRMSMSLDVSSKGTVGQKPLATISTLQGLVLVTIMNCHVLLESLIIGKGFVAQFTLLSCLHVRCVIARECWQSMLHGMLHQLQPCVILALTALSWALELHLLMALVLW